MQLQRPTRLKETGLTPTAVLTVSLQQALAGQTISSRYDMPLLEVSLGRRDSATLLSSLAALPSKPTINDFIMMAGLGPLATEAEVVRVLGAPSRRRPSSQWVHLYYAESNADRVASAALDASSGLLTHVMLEGREGLAALAYLRARNIDDPKANFLGRHKEDVLALFGKPNRENADILESISSRGGVNIKVQFTCYSHRGYQCTNVAVVWSK